jgi:hypothetical protein
MRGLNPSVLGLLLTSSVYQSVQAVGGVGMLVQYSWFTGGDSVSSQNFQISDGLSLRFQFSRSDTTFFTQQTTILTFFQTIASLSGALGALYAVTLAALGCFESLFFKSREKRRQKKEERMQRLKEIKIALDLKVPDPDAKPGDAPKMKLTDEEWAQLQADSQDTFSLFECMCCCFMVCLRKAAAEDEDLDIDEQLEAPAAAKSSAVSVAQKGDVEMTVTVAPPIKTSVSLPKIARTATAADIVPAPLNPLLASDPVDLRKPSTPPAMLRRKSTMMAPPPPPAGGVPIQKPALVTKLTLPPSS